MAEARRLLPSSLNGRGRLRLYTALAQIRSHLACEGNPILADRLGSIFLARVIQTNAVTRGNKGCRQISCQGVFFVIYRAQLCHTIRSIRWAFSPSEVGRLANGPEAFECEGRFTRKAHNE